MIATSSFTTTSLVASLYPGALTLTVYVPFATFPVVNVVPTAAPVATTEEPLVTVTAAPVTLVVTVIAPSLKAENFDFSSIASNQCLWVCMRCGVTF